MFDLTPDLSKEFHPIPKPNAKEKKTKKPLGIGKKTKLWNVERSELIEEFEKLGITECELQLKGCWKNTALGFAHADKRRNLTPEDLPKVILICNPCHMEIEQYNRVRMKKIIEKVIRERI